MLSFAHASSAPALAPSKVRARGNGCAPAQRPVASNLTRNAVRSSALLSHGQPSASRGQLACAAVSPGGETSGSTLADIKALLNAAVNNEDYELAARLRDELKSKEIDANLSLEEANRKFYRAFSAGDYDAMAEVWGEGDYVQCIHPGSNVIASRELVMESWKIVLRGTRQSPFDVTIQDVRVHAGATDGWVTCVELVDTDESMGRLVATNVFELQDGEWKMVQHHASAAPRL